VEQFIKWNRSTTFNYNLAGKLKAQYEIQIQKTLYNVVTKI